MKREHFQYQKSFSGREISRHKSPESGTCLVVVKEVKCD